MRNGRLEHHQRAHTQHIQQQQQQRQHQQAGPPPVPRSLPPAAEDSRGGAPQGHVLARMYHPPAVASATPAEDGRQASSSAPAAAAMPSAVAAAHGQPDCGPPRGKAEHEPARSEPRAVIKDERDSGVTTGWAREIDYQSVFADANIAMAITSVDGRFMECNRRFEDDSGYSREELRELTVFNLIEASELQHTFSQVAQMLHGGSGASGDGGNAAGGGGSGASERPMPAFTGRAVLKKPSDPPRSLSLSLVHDDADRPRYFHLSLTQQADCSIP